MNDTRIDMYAEYVKKLSEDDTAILIQEAIIRLKEASYARGYKDGFNDGKDTEYKRQMFVKEENK